MKKTRTFLSAAIATVLAASVMVSDARAQAFDPFAEFLSAARAATPATAPRITTAAPQLRTWMHADVGAAWREGWRGQGTTITVVDDFTGARFTGNLGPGVRNQTHGGWVRDWASLIAPNAAVVNQNWVNTQAVPVAARGLNVINLSFGVMARTTHNVSSARDVSIVNHARTGRAVVVKAAGNHAVAVDAANAQGNFDILNRALIGTQSVIFAGALDRHGAPNNLAHRASYSNFAGPNTAVQDRFLMTAVRSDASGMAGTSFAAPVISGYAAILGSKFNTATPTQIANRLLDTARTDTIHSYDRAVHGRGEASLSRALAPARIN